ncbi:CASP9 [Branchiostoma lanceolatum]|uniref:CASP9 protein n=1 Tax=Branchiostoma lanceolatum TaxID=7740 RepID=A0A8J9Z5X1_BRALA|nr:CASP9 [Branchiostoma lanceolatum]
MKGTGKSEKHGRSDSKMEKITSDEKMTAASRDLRDDLMQAQEHAARRMLVHREKQANDGLLLALSDALSRIRERRAREQVRLETVTSIKQLHEWYEYGKGILKHGDGLESILRFRNEIKWLRRFYRSLLEHLYKYLERYFCIERHTDHNLQGELHRIMVETKDVKNLLDQHFVEANVLRPNVQDKDPVVSLVPFLYLELRHLIDLFHEWRIHVRYRNKLEEVEQRRWLVRRQEMQRRHVIDDISERIVAVTREMADRETRLRHNVAGLERVKAVISQQKGIHEEIEVLELQLDGLLWERTKFQKMAVEIKDELRNIPNKRDYKRDKIKAEQRKVVADFDKNQIKINDKRKKLEEKYRVKDWYEKSEHNLVSITLEIADDRRRITGLAKLRETLERERDSARKRLQDLNASAANVELKLHSLHTDYLYAMRNVEQVRRIQWQVDGGVDLKRGVRVRPNEVRVSDLKKRGEAWYEMTSHPRGRAIIINNDSHCTMYDDYRDVRHLTDVFEQLGFAVTLEENISASEMENQASRLAEDNFPGCSALVVVVLSPGHDRRLHGSDKQGISHRDFLAQFEEAFGKKMKGKPTLFLLMDTPSGNDVSTTNDDDFYSRFYEPDLPNDNEDDKDGGNNQDGTSKSDVFVACCPSYGYLLCEDSSGSKMSSLMDSFNGDLSPRSHSVANYTKKEAMEDASDEERGVLMQMQEHFYRQALMTEKAKYDKFFREEVSRMLGIAAQRRRQYGLPKKSHESCDTIKALREWITWETKRIGIHRDNEDENDVVRNLRMLLNRIDYVKILFTDIKRYLITPLQTYFAISAEFNAELLAVRRDLTKGKQQCEKLLSDDYKQITDGHAFEAIPNEKRFPVLVVVPKAIGILCVITDLATKWRIHSQFENNLDNLWTRRASLDTPQMLQSKKEEITQLENNVQTAQRDFDEISRDVREFERDAKDSQFSSQYSGTSDQLEQAEREVNKLLQEERKLQRKIKSMTERLRSTRVGAVKIRDMLNQSKEQLTKTQEALYTRTEELEDLSSRKKEFDESEQEFLRGGFDQRRVELMQMKERQRHAKKKLSLFKHKRRVAQPPGSERSNPGTPAYRPPALIARLNCPDQLDWQLEERRERIKQDFRAVREELISLDTEHDKVTQDYDYVKGIMDASLKSLWRDQSPDAISVLPNRMTREKLKTFPVYDIHQPKGICLIICNEIVRNKLKCRHSVRKDLRGLASLFRQLGYQIVVKENLTSSQIVEALISLSDEYHEFSGRYSSVVVVVMAHGDASGRLVGTDLQPVSINELTSHFQHTRCPSLMGQPKMFFIQTCMELVLEAQRMGNPDVPGEISPRRNGFKSTFSLNSYGPLIVTPEEPRLPDNSDFFVAQAIMFPPLTTPVLISSLIVQDRTCSPENCFLNAIVRVFAEYACVEDLLSMMGRVEDCVASTGSHDSYTGRSSPLQMSYVKHTLGKQIFFMPGM